MPTATVTSKRQITIPAETCVDLRITPGTKIDFVKNAAGETIIRPKTGDIRALKGIANYKGSPKTLAEIDQGIADAVAERLKRCV